jgi:hypothetical protein
LAFGTRQSREIDRIVPSITGNDRPAVQPFGQGERVVEPLDQQRNSHWFTAALAKPTSGTRTAIETVNIACGERVG